MRDMIERSCEPDRVSVAVSIGVALSVREDRSAEDLLARADEAMYAAKRTSHLHASTPRSFADARARNGPDGPDGPAEPVAMVRDGLSILERSLRKVWADECDDPELTPDVNRLQVAAR